MENNEIKKLKLQSIWESSVWDDIPKWKFIWWDIEYFFITRIWDLKQGILKLFHFNNDKDEDEENLD